MNKNETSINVLIADAVLRLQAMQNIFVKKGLFTDKEFQLEVEQVSKNIMKSILEKAKVPGDLDKLIDDLSLINKFEENKSE